MAPSRFDALVVGGGPAGSIASLVLARGGAKVALVDKSTFPREKACGDAIGPRGLQLLSDLEVAVPADHVLGDMLVIGPTGRAVRLPCTEGLTYPGHGILVTREVFDARLHEHAVAAGAVPFVGRADEPLEAGGRLEGFRLSTGEELRADFVIGADGATSRVAAAAGLVEAERVLWGFAIRTYLPQKLDLPLISFWEPTPWRAFPGYGWAFPGGDGISNIGLGVGTLSNRRAGTRAVRELPRFLEHLRGLGFIDNLTPTPTTRLGGWLKMGMVGTNPAAGRVLLVGDACGLVNPLQGEGISQAMTSGRQAAEAILAGPGSAGDSYRAGLVADHLPYHRITAALQSAVLPRPFAIATVSRLLTAFGGAGIAGGWSVFWNELLEGAPPGSQRRIAALATQLGSAASSTTSTARWFRTMFPR
ncbi:MAG: geranylgeranyl reductase family protein [Acidimicrobiales bacterium]